MPNSEMLRLLAKLAGKRLVRAVEESHQRTQQADERFSITQKRPHTWHSPGNVIQALPLEQGVRLVCQHASVEIEWVASDCLRVQLTATQPETHSRPIFSYAVMPRVWPPVAFSVVEEEDAVELKTDSAVCRISRAPLLIRLETPDGRVLCSDASGIRFRQDGRLSLGLSLKADEACYGMGARVSGLNLRGGIWHLWNADPPHFQPGADPLYYSIPFYLGLHHQGAYGVFWDNSSRGVVDIGASNARELTFEAEGGELCYYLFAGPDTRRVLGRYTELTGRIPLPPLWALGYHQSRFSYDSQEKVLKLAEEFRERHIPCDALYLDIHYMDGFRVFTWDKTRFPDPRAMCERLHHAGFHVVAIVDPGICIDPDYAVYQDGIQSDVFLKHPDGELAAAAVWPGLCHFPDFTDPQVRRWWAGHLVRWLDAGLDGVWNDMDEPTIFTPEGAGTLPDYVQHKGDGCEGDHVSYHNVYGLLMARAAWEAQREQRPDRRPFNIVRAGYAGAQRYASSWTGDNASTWDHLRLSISMVLNMGLSGAPVTGPDVGGFSKDAEPELFTRWLQAAALMPFFRSHTSLNTAAQEPWSFGPAYEAINREIIKLRYQLLPYLYSVLAQAREYGWPVVRPLFMAEEDNAALRSIDDCYLLGDALLVAPVLMPGKDRRSVYLPVGQWYDFWTNEMFIGGQMIETAAPLERLPLFVRAGAVLPLWPSMNYVHEQPIKELCYRVFSGSLDNILYEDRGEGLEYEEGNYRWVYITCERSGGHLFINRRTAGRYTPDYRFIRVEVIGLRREPIQVRIDRQGAPVWFYDDGLLEVKTDPFQQIHIICESSPTDETLLRRPW